MSLILSLNYLQTVIHVKKVVLYWRGYINFIDYWKDNGDASPKNCWVDSLMMVHFWPKHVAIFSMIM